MINGKGVIGVGSPIVDRLARVNDDFLSRIDGHKGGMELVDSETMTQLLDRVGGAVVVAPGGSAANTVFALARLGIPSVLLGKLGDDREGEFYRQAFEQIGGDGSRLKTCDVSSTACCLSLITPDSERTMRTDLGAASGFLPEEVSPKDFDNCRHAHVEGYLLFNRALAESVLDAAKTAGCRVSLDLGSFEVVKASEDVLPSLLDEYVDVVLANEDEASAFCGSNDPWDGLRALSEHCQVTAVKMGADGALIKSNGLTCQVFAQPVDKVVDTTGAGDFWAAGFLYGLLHDYRLDDCGHLGAVMGAEAVGCLGADLPKESWERTVYFFNTFVNERKRFCLRK